MAKLTPSWRGTLPLSRAPGAAGGSKPPARVCLEAAGAGITPCWEFETSQARDFTVFRRPLGLLKANSSMEASPGLLLKRPHFEPTWITWGHLVSSRHLRHSSWLRRKTRLAPLPGKRASVPFVERLKAGNEACGDGNEEEAGGDKEAPPAFGSKRPLANIQTRSIG